MAGPSHLLCHFVCVDVEWRADSIFPSRTSTISSVGAPAYPRKSETDALATTRVRECFALTRGILGNDIEDENSGPPAPVKTVEKTSTHTTKRNADGVAQTKVPVNTAPRRTGPGGNEGGMSPLFPA